MWIMLPGLLAMALSMCARAQAEPPVNPFLAASHYAIGHVGSAQQDSVALPGPLGPTRTLKPTELEFVPLGPAHFGAFTSGPYADGGRVFWSNGLDRITKVDFDTYKVLATWSLPGVRHYSEADARTETAGFEANEDGLLAMYRAFRAVAKLRDLSSVYTLLDRDNVYYVGDSHGRIAAYGDQRPGDRHSPIAKLREFSLPAGVTGPMVGMNMTYDGWLLVVTEHGYVVAVSRDFRQSRFTRLKYSEGAEKKSFGPGYGWIRNSLAVDDRGGIYIASQEHLHKLIWRGESFSQREADGAWTEPYLNGWKKGSGSTPVLMGFGGEDELVVISDGEPLMNVVLYWRNAIPPGWRAPRGAPSRRIAGMQPVNLGNPELKQIQSEQAVVVSGYGALVVNNIPRNRPWFLPDRLANALLAGYLGSVPAYPPYGVQKFEWDAQRRQLRSAWVNASISSPNAVPIVSRTSGLAYLIGAREGHWTLEALDWASGASAFHYVIGGASYNSLYSGTLIDEQGRIHYGTPWGRVRLRPDLSAPPNLGRRSSSSW
jgi:hypothetical protein